MEMLPYQLAPFHCVLSMIQSDSDGEDVGLEATKDTEHIS